MRFALAPEQEQLKASVRDYLAARSPLAQARAAAESEDGFDRALWREMAEQQGLHAVAIPERHGGAGFGFVELAVVLEQLGAALLPGPFFASAVLAAAVLACCEDEDAAGELLPGIADGTTIATLASVERGGDWDAGAVDVAATPADGGGHVLDGCKPFVLDGHVADLILVTARLDGAVRLFAVAGDAPGLTRAKLPALDVTRSLARLDLAGTPARLIAGRDAVEVVTDALRRAAIGLAAEQVGGARRCLDMSVRYATERVAFKRTIGSFQTIKHRCADNFLEIESAAAAALYAAWAVEHAPGEVASVASLAKAFCSETYYRVAADNIQIHGGIGFTWEHDAHLHLKRARSSETLLGGVAHHRELLARQIGL